MKNLSAALLIVIVSISTQAQKLPNTQQVSLHAPANVKIDGKATEWGEKFQAYNPATEVFYTMANDDKKLYLVVQASTPGVINNIANGGIRLTIQKAGRKSDNGAPFIKFPYTQPVSSLMVAPQGMGNLDADAGMKEYNKLLHANTKWIYTRGLSGVDTLLSVYNEHGIAAANAIDVKRVYTCELAVDLSRFGLAIENGSKFSYHIIVNAEPNRYTGQSTNEYLKRVLIANTRDGDMAKTNQALESWMNASNKFTSSSDFWGEYTLAK